VEQAQLELQLKVWKELAISKQVLMRSATDALKLDPNCSQDELKTALESALKKVADADASVVRAQQEAKQAVTSMEKKLADSLKAQASAETTAAQLQTTLDNATKQIAIERTAIAKELQGYKDRLAEKDKAIKAINTALADTPENVLRKMKALRKEKQEEADARRQVESTANTLRKEKREQDQQLTELKDNSAKLVTLYRELHAVCTKLQEQLKPLLAQDAELPALPELDAKLLESIEHPGAKADHADSKRKK
jgi:chromosome segregation ATPase